MDSDAVPAGSGFAASVPADNVLPVGSIWRYYRRRVERVPREAIFCPFRQSSREGGWTDSARHVVGNILLALTFLGAALPKARHF